MVSFQNQGRAGNWLFQACTCIAYALKHGIEFSVPSTTNNQQWNPIYFQNLINTNWIEEKKDIVLKEQEYFRYDELPYCTAWKRKQIILDGYWQNKRYFEKYRKELMDIFGFSSVTTKGHVSIHQRRGDYLTIKDKHIVPNKEWYKEAMKQFPGYKFVFFSDDIEHCKKEFGDRDDCIFMEGFNEIQDLFLMAKMEHHINSSSTFSWMGAFFSANDKAKIITPKEWMTPRHRNQWMEEDLIPKTWIKL